MMTVDIERPEYIVPTRTVTLVGMRSRRGPTTTLSHLQSSGSPTSQISSSLSLGVNLLQLLPIMEALPSELLEKMAVFLDPVCSKR
jgi:hypothetical protein